MYVGLLCEGIYDEAPLRIIIPKIIRFIRGDASIEFVVLCVRGTITPQRVEQAHILFFEHEPKKCSLALFIADTDKHKGKYRELSESIKTFVEPSIIGCPNPVLEQWFFSEETAIKKIFRLPSTKPLPFQNKHPKKRLGMIYDKFDKDPTKSLEDRYCDIAKELNLELLCRRNKSYKKFHRGLLKEVRLLPLT